MTVQGSASERRIDQRVAYICEVQVDGMRESGLGIRTSDISAGGVFIDSMVSFPVGSIVSFRLKLPSTDLQLSGEVRYCMPQVGMGIRLLDTSVEDRQLIESIIQGQIRPSCFDLAV